MIMRYPFGAAAENTVLPSALPQTAQFRTLQTQVPAPGFLDKLKAWWAGQSTVAKVAYAAGAVALVAVAVRSASKKYHPNKSKRRRRRRATPNAGLLRRPEGTKGASSESTSVAAPARSRAEVARFAREQFMEAGRSQDRGSGRERMAHEGGESIYGAAARQAGHPLPGQDATPATRRTLYNLGAEAAAEKLLRSAEGTRFPTHYVDKAIRRSDPFQAGYQDTINRAMDTSGKRQREAQKRVDEAYRRQLLEDIQHEAEMLEAGIVGASAEPLARPFSGPVRASESDVTPVRLRFLTQKDLPAVGRKRRKSAATPNRRRRVRRK